MEKKNYDCILWENGGCSVYSARPIQCKTYPFWSNVLQNENSWNNEIKDCPGINSGDFHSFTEINEKLTLYKNNKPLKKGDIE